MEKDWNMISKREASDILGIRTSTITNWIIKNKCPFPFYKLTPRTIRFKRTDVVAYLEKVKNAGK